MALTQHMGKCNFPSDHNDQEEKGEGDKGDEGDEVDEDDDGVAKVDDKGCEIEISPAWRCEVETSPSGG